MKWNSKWNTKGISKKKSLTIRDFNFTFVVPPGHDNYRENLGHTIKGNELVVFEQSKTKNGKDFRLPRFLWYHLVTIAIVRTWHTL